MTDVDRLLREYVERYTSGAPADPGEFLDRVEGGERRELEALIDAFLARAPRRPFDRERFAQTPRAVETVDAFSRSLAGSAGLWPAVLPRLREAARLRRREVVERLAAALGVAGKEQKVGAYYHAMEQGQLPAGGVSERVLEALGSIVGQSAEALRRAGTGLEPGARAPGEAPAFARTAMPSDEYADAAPSAGAPAERVGDAGEWDEVDRLFRGG